jgi:hypothetical protein
VVDEGHGEEPRAVQVGIKGPKVVMKKNKLIAKEQKGATGD